MEQEDKNSFSGRLRRYAKVTGAVGGLAARAAGQRYLGLDLGKQQMPSELKSALGNLKGPVMKVAQILATIPDALPEEYVKELQQLQSNAPSMGRLFVKRRMTGELGSDWKSRFSYFDENSVAAASLGQVHRANSLDGTELACKLQYPDMGSAVEADLRQLRIAMSLYERYDSAIKASEIYKELSARIREELDYLREGRNMTLYKMMLENEPNVNVPNFYENLSTERLITMSWLKGSSLLNYIAANKNQEARNHVAINMFRAWYIPFYLYGIIHGDPHLGNYSITEEGDVNLMDFGCIRVFPASFVKGVIDLYHGLRDDNEELAVEAYKTWGFENLDMETINVLNQWARFVYAPLMEDKIRSIQDTNSGAYGREVVQKVHRELRRLNGVKPPREFVLMDRAAIGLGSVFLHLKAEVNWYKIFQDLINDFDPSKLANRQEQILTAASVPQPE
ncbi:MAG: AarF/UbiB family protein [Pseudomonadota bacterium]|nr:AarF/UbiB family protein [Pseudomonadota bacterium]